MKKVLKFSLVLFVVLCITFMCIQNFVDASTYSSEMQNLIKADYSDSTNSVKQVNNLVATILSSIRLVGVAVAIAALLVLAMKYMTAAPGDKADIKKGLTTYVIGACIFFGVVGILEVINNFANAIK